MSDLEKINLPVRRMSRVSAPGTKHNYQVFEQETNGAWRPASPERPHSTTAFADLGRLYQKDVIAVIGEEKDLV